MCVGARKPEGSPREGDKETIWDVKVETGISGVAGFIMGESPREMEEGKGAGSGGGSQLKLNIVFNAARKLATL